MGSRADRVPMARRSARCDGAPRSRRSRSRTRAALLLLALAALLLRGGEHVALMEGREVGHWGDAPRWIGWPRRCPPAARSPGLPPKCRCLGMRAWCCSGDFLSPLAEIQAVVARLRRNSGDRHAAAGARSRRRSAALHRRNRFRGLEREGETFIPPSRRYSRSLYRPIARATGRLARCLRAAAGFVSAFIARTIRPKRLC